MESIIPRQQTGSQSDITHTRRFKTFAATAHKFSQAKEKLLNVFDWDQVCGNNKNVFTLTDENGIPVHRPVQKGDHFRIDIPGPGTVGGDGYDWVRVEEIDTYTDPSNYVESCAIRVRPALNPTEDNENTSHFFKEAATSTFRVSRRGTKITAAVHGRNEMPNTRQDHLIDTVRNTLVAVMAIMGLSGTQWKKLVNGLLE